MIKIGVEQDNFSDKNIDFIAKEILRGGVVVLPTDTIYGLSVLATNRRAVEKLYKIKKRPRNKSFIVLMKSFCMLRKYCFLNKSQYDFIKRELDNPRPLSIILKGRDGELSHLSQKDDNSLAVRIPKRSDFMMRLLKKINSPIISTSLNSSGKSEIGNLINLEKFLDIDKIDLAVDGGLIVGKTASRVIDLRDLNNIRILRD